MNDLTQAEFSVAYLIVMGLSVKQAATRCGITTSAAKARLRNTYQKLGITDNHAIRMTKIFEKENL